MLNRVRTARRHLLWPLLGLFVAAVMVAAIMSTGCAAHDGQEVKEPSVFRLGRMAAVQGDWLYYSCLTADPQKSNWEIHKIKVDGTGDAKLIDSDMPAEMTVAGDWIYYEISLDKGGGEIHKLKTDGSSQEKISTGVIGSMEVSGDWLYITDLYGGGGLYRLKTDGSESVQVTKQTAYFQALVDDWIYYFDAEQILNKMKTDGTGQERIYDQAGIMYGEWLYVISPDNNTLQRVKIDGSGQSQTINLPQLAGQVRGLSVAGDWIYFNCWIVQGETLRTELHKVKIDGTGETKLSDETVYFFNVSGNWIYYIGADEQQGLTFKRMKTDGSEPAIIVTPLFERTS
jgi:hypothetical protein